LVRYNTYCVSTSVAREPTHNKAGGHFPLKAGCLVYTGCPGGNVPDLGRMFLKLKYTDLTKNAYIRI